MASGLTAGEEPDVGARASRVDWKFGRNSGTGNVSSDSLQMKGWDQKPNDYCWGFGSRGFTEGTHSWEVAVDYTDTIAPELSGEVDVHDNVLNGPWKIVQVGIIDSEEIGKNITTDRDENRWVLERKFTERGNANISLSLDMEARRLEVKVKSAASQVVGPFETVGVGLPGHRIQTIHCVHPRHCVDRGDQRYRRAHLDEIPRYDEPIQTFKFPADREIFPFFACDSKHMEIH